MTPEAAADGPLAVLPLATAVLASVYGARRLLPVIVAVAVLAVALAGLRAPRPRPGARLGAHARRSVRAARGVRRGAAQHRQARRLQPVRYLTKDADGDEVLRAVREVAAVNSYVSPTLATFLPNSSRDRNVGPKIALSSREREVLSLLASGERDQDIADTLAISVRTVRSHLDRIRDKAGRRRRSDLTRLAIEEGIVRGPVG